MPESGGKTDGQGGQHGATGQDSGLHGAVVPAGGKGAGAGRTGDGQRRNGAQPGGEVPAGGPGSAGGRTERALCPVHLPDAAQAGGAGVGHGGPQAAHGAGAAAGAPAEDRALSRRAAGPGHRGAAAPDQRRRPGPRPALAHASTWTRPTLSRVDGALDQSDVEAVPERHDPGGRAGLPARRAGAAGGARRGAS